MFPSGLKTSPSQEQQSWLRLWLEAESVDMPIDLTEPKSLPWTLLLIFELFREKSKNYTASCELNTSKNGRWGQMLAILRDKIHPPGWEGEVQRDQNMKCLAIFVP